MKRVEIPADDFSSEIFSLWGKQWLLLTAGNFDKGEFNPMTVAWGSFGVIWQKPFAMIAVRPTRHTFKFTEKFDSFTLCAFPDSYKKALNLCGSKSGRDTDKVKEAGITPIASTKIDAPGFKEAELIMECKKMYYDLVKPSNFLDSSIGDNYPEKDYHTIYFGEILAVRGTDKYLHAK